MILDKFENAALYESCHPRFKAAFDFLRQHDLVALPTGKIELDGKNLFINVLDFKGKAEADCRMETHHDYIDIQMPVNGCEQMGWKATADLQEVTTPYNTEKDVAFYADKATTQLNVQAGQFAIFFPCDGHQPGIAEGKEYRKIIVKVKVR